MKKTAVVIAGVLILAGLSFAVLTMAGFIRVSLPWHGMAGCARVGEKCCCSPFGGYCRGHGWGWYGADRTIKSTDEARKAIGAFFSPETVNVAGLDEKGTFFEAEVRDRDNKLIDRVIIDKRTGRISSIY